MSCGVIAVEPRRERYSDPDDHIDHVAQSHRNRTHLVGWGPLSRWNIGT
jgi:hypothetical protein